MDPYPNSHDSTSPATAKHKNSFWQKLGGGSLSFAVIFHILLLVIGMFWIFSSFPVKKPDPDFAPKGGGGGNIGAEAKNKKQRVPIPTVNMARVIAQGAVGLTLPDPDMANTMVSIGSLKPSGGGLSGGFGGKGSGGGNGDGIGKDFGNNNGFGNAGGGKGTLFGMPSMDMPGLNGVFYDFKQTRNEKENAVSPEEVQEILNDFTTRGDWRESALNKYYKAKQKLIQTKIYIPKMSAELAPAAFNCADNVKASRWAVIYSGTVSPPRSGKYRFVGAGDDILVVRFNNKNVFDHGYYSGTMPVHLSVSDKIAQMKGEVDAPELKKMMRRNSPMEIPIKFYDYPSTQKLSQDIGGLAVGPEFQAEAGKNYPIEILISELPGGLFSSVLLIEEAGVEYEKAPGGSPILPLFRLDGGLPDFGKGESAPPIDPNGSVWKAIPSGKGGDI